MRRCGFHPRFTSPQGAGLDKPDSLERLHRWDVLSLIEPESLQGTVDALVEGKPDLLILDHSMPAFQGPSLVRACFEHPDLSGIKVIILTAFHDEDIAVRMQKLGVACVLHKPILHGDLTLAVEQALAAPPKAD